MKRLLLAPAFLAFALAGGPALADDPDARSAEREKWCQEHPEKCEELKARRDEYCKKNPATCEQRRKKLGERKAWCEANPEKCREMKDQRHERREAWREKCEANKEDCEQLKQERDARRKERSDAFCKDNPDQCDGKPE